MARCLLSGFTFQNAAVFSREELAGGGVSSSASPLLVVYRTLRENREVALHPHCSLLRAVSRGVPPPRFVLFWDVLDHSPLPPGGTTAYPQARVVNKMDAGGLLMADEKRGGGGGGGRYFSGGYHDDRLTRLELAAEE